MIVELISAQGIAAASSAGDIANSPTRHLTGCAQMRALFVIFISDEPMDF